MCHFNTQVVTRSARATNDLPKILIGRNIILGRHVALVQSSKKIFAFNLTSLTPHKLLALFKARTISLWYSLINTADAVTQVFCGCVVMSLLWTTLIIFHLNECVAEQKASFSL
jgi:hypothetical protein